MAALGTATAATATLFIDQKLDLSVAPADLARWWWLRLLVIYGLSILALAAAAFPLRARPAMRPILAVVLAVWWVSALLGNGFLWELLAAIEEPMRSRLVAALAAGFVALALLPWRGRAMRIGRLGLAVAGSAIVWFGLERPPGPSAPPALVQAAREAVASTPAPPLLVIGLDGADWELIDRLSAAGKLPNLNLLRAEGAWGPLATLHPTLSPLIWTTMVTGRPPEEHGVLRLQVDRPVGMTVGTQGRAIRARFFGFATVRSLLNKTGQLARGPVTGSERRVPAIWTIATFFGRDVSVVSWWATWPAERILGEIVSDRVYYDRAWAMAATDNPSERLTFPEGLARRMRELVVRPPEITYVQAARFLDVSPAEFDEFRKLAYVHHDIRSEFQLYLSMFESDRSFARELFRMSRERGRPRGAAFVLFRLVDHASHCCLRFSPLVPDDLDSSPEDRRRFGRFVAQAYEEADATLGELVRDSGAANVLVLSDHGFRLEERKGGAKRYAHVTGPPGIFVGAGPAFRPGRVEGLSVYDVMPLLLFLQGLPVPRDIRPLRQDVLSPSLLAMRPPAYVPSLDFVPVVDARAATLASDAQILEEFRALGYLN